ncbi:MAG TPA: sigma-54 dependent transcriptional regulator [Candidatus Binataceae bacterium]|nr:sigma-54 dependent transcriptional regulator [Candidatus Binataceae bacterium]
MARIASAVFDFSDSAPELEVPALRYYDAVGFHQPEIIEVSRLLAGAHEVGQMVAKSAAMLRTFEELRKLSLHRTSVLIHGESGTGKELAASALHTLGSRVKGPLITFNCSNLVDSLAESQLFGHVRGAFTDARDESQGYFRTASGGTLVLDEIGELPMRLQAKLLRAVESCEILPVGGSRSYKVDVRIVACTNRDLRAMVGRGEFRADLYYRLAATSVHLQPLRERPDDVPVLLAHFLRGHQRTGGRQVTAIARSALSLLCDYSWPGNVRELSNAVERATVMASGAVLEVGDFPDELRQRQPLPTESEAVHASSGLLDHAIRGAVVQSLTQTDGNRLRAAKLLGVSRSTLYRLMARLKIEA